MANTFKNASIASVPTNGFSSGGTLYTCPGSTTSIILGIAITNKTDNSAHISIQFTDSSASGTRLLLNEVAIPANTTLEVLAGQKYVLEASDILKEYYYFL